MYKKLIFITLLSIVKEFNDTVNENTPTHILITYLKVKYLQRLSYHITHLINNAQFHVFVIFSK